MSNRDRSELPTDDEQTLDSSPRRPSLPIGAPPRRDSAESVPMLPPFLAPRSASPPPAVTLDLAPPRRPESSGTHPAVASPTKRPSSEGRLSSGSGFPKVDPRVEPIADGEVPKYEVLPDVPLPPRRPSSSAVNLVVGPPRASSRPLTLRLGLPSCHASAATTAPPPADPLGDIVEVSRESSVTERFELDDLSPASPLEVHDPPAPPGILPAPRPTTPPSEVDAARDDVVIAHTRETRASVAADLLRTLAERLPDAPSLVASTLMSGDDDELQVEFLRLTAMGKTDTSTRGVLVLLLRSSSETLRVRTVEAIGAHREPGAFTLLQRHAEHRADERSSSPEEMAVVGRAMTLVDCARAIEAFREWVRPPGIIQRLVKSDAYAARVRAAAAGLARHPSDEADELLREMAASVTSEALRRAVDDAVSERAQRSAGTP